jgi:hypothetical protein
VKRVLLTFPVSHVGQSVTLQKAVVGGCGESTPAGAHVSCIDQTPPWILFLLHNILQFAWSVHGGSIYFFRRRIPADTRLEMFASSVTTVAVPRADKAVCSQMRFGSGQKDYAARTDSAPQFQQKSYFGARR